MTIKQFWLTSFKSTILLITIPLLALSQTYKSLNKDLGLRQDLIFGSNVKFDGDGLLMDGYLLLQDVKHPIFNQIGIIYNEQDQLTEYRYMANESDSSRLNSEYLLKVIEKYYGNKSFSDTSENSIIWHFKKGDEFVNLTIRERNLELQISTNSLLKAVQQFDSALNANVIEITGLVKNYSEHSISGKVMGEYQISFTGLVEKNVISICFGGTPKDSKSLKFKLDNNQIISIIPVNRNRMMKNYYSNLIILPKNIADSLYNSSTVKILTTGNYKDEIEIKDRQLKAFKLIYNLMYK